MRNGLACYLAIFTLASSHGEEIPLEFELLPNSSTATVSLSTGDSDSKTISYAGTILANVTSDRESLRASRIEFTGGSIQLPDAEFNVSGNIFYTGIGTFPTQLGIANTGVRARLSSPNGPGAVSSVNGEIDSAFHASTIYDGLGTFTVAINGISETQTVDLSAEPTTSPYDDDTQILISEFARRPDKRILKFVIETSISDSDSELIEGSSATFNTTEVGYYEAVAFAELPTALGDWLDLNGLSLPDLDTRNPYGVPYSLIYALDLPIDAKGLPIAFDANAEGALPYALISLPESGLKRQVIPYFSYDLQPGSWAPVSGGNYLDGVDSLLPGRTGTVRIAFNEWTHGFLRFAVGPTQ